MDTTFQAQLLICTKINSICQIEIARFQGGFHAELLPTEIFQEVTTPGLEILPTIRDILAICN